MQYRSRSRDIFSLLHNLQVGRDSSVGTATRYELEGAGIESRWGGGEFSAPVQTGPGTHPPSLLYNGYLLISGDKAIGAEP